MGKFASAIQVLASWLGLSIGAAHAVDLEKIPGTRVKISKPPGFVRADTFPGFQKAEATASIMISEIPAPYKLCSAGFTVPEKMAEKGMKLLSRVENNVGNFEGQLVEVQQQAAGIDFRKWILMFGDDTFSEIVTATFPSTKAKELSEIMKSAVLTTAFDSGAAEPVEQKDLGFELSDVPGLKLASRIQNALVFTETGQLPDKKLDYTPSAFVAAQSFSLTKLVIDDRAAYARQRLEKSPEIDGPEIFSESDLSIAGMPGREILATAKSKAKENLFIYQVMLFSDKGYYIMRGDCQTKFRNTQEPIFRQITKTFKLK